MGWYQGTVEEVINEKTLKVRILWDVECLGVSNVGKSDHKWVKGNWNPKTAKKGRMATKFVWRLEMS